MASDDQKAGGERLKKAIHVARARADIASDMELALRAHVSYDTLMNWYSGRTTPRPAELRKVAGALNVRLSDLMDAFEGRDAMPPTLDEAIRELVEEIRLWRTEDRDRMRAMLRLVGDLAAEIVPPRVSEARVGTQYVTDGNRERTA